MEAQRKGHSHIGTLSFLAFDGQCTVMFFHDLLGNGKPQTGTAHGAGARLVHAVETFEHTGNVGFGNPDPVGRKRGL